METQDVLTFRGVLESAVNNGSQQLLQPTAEGISIARVGAVRTLIRAGPHSTYDCVAKPCLQGRKPAEGLTGFKRKSLKPDEWMPATCAGQ